MFFAILLCFTFSIKHHKDLEDINIDDIDEDDLKEMKEHFETNSGRKWGKIIYLLRLIDQAKQKRKAKSLLRKKEKEKLREKEEHIQTSSKNYNQRFTDDLKELEQGLSLIAQNLIGKESLENEVKTYMDIFRDKRELDDFLFQISKDNIDINSATSIFYAYKASIMIEHTLYDAVSFAAKSEHYGRNSTNEDTKKAVSLVKNLFQSQTDEDQALIQQQLSQLYMKFVKIK